jgi:glycine C-acetyltransferase
MLREERRVKPYQGHLFIDDTKPPEGLPADPVFIYEDRRYLNFSTLDCFHLRNNDYLKEAAKLGIDAQGLTGSDGRNDAEEQLKKAMADFKKTEALLFFPDEISAAFAAFSRFGPKATFFVDCETSPTILAVLQSRNIEYYKHEDLDQLRKLLAAHSERVLVLDGIYEWSGTISPMNGLIGIAKETDCFVVGNELGTFGFLGRDGRGLVDFFNLYDEVNLEIGSFHRFLGGFGAYVAAKKYLINKVWENIARHAVPVPQFLLDVNRAGLEFLRDEKANKKMFQKLWSHSRYIITRLKQDGFNTRSDTPIVVVAFGNEDEAKGVAHQLFQVGVIVGQYQERIRIIPSIEHTQEDIDTGLDKLLGVTRDLGIK